MTCFFQVQGQRFDLRDFSTSFESSHHLVVLVLVVEEVEV